MAGVEQVISVDVRAATLHGLPPMVTMSAGVAVLLPLVPSLINSKPRPLMVRRDPPPIEPLTGVIEVITLMYWKVRLDAATPCGRITETGTRAGGALGTVHVTLVNVSRPSAAATDAQS